MSFGSPYLLATLVVPVLALLAYLWIERKPPRSAISFPNLGVLATVAGRSGWRRHFVTGLLLGVLLLLCFAVARPRVPLAANSSSATVVLVVDVSYSMVATDVAPTRLDAARAAITSFVDHVPPGVKIGLVAFADDPVVVTTPTADHGVVKAGISSLTPGFGTAIGDALARAVDLVKASTGQTGSTKPSGAAAKKGAVVLLSDGHQTHGVLAPNEGAHLAEVAGVPVYTIALGTLSGTVTINRFGSVSIVPVPPDRSTLKGIAEETGGSSYEVTDAKRLSSVYSGLGRTVARTTKRREVTAAFVAVAAALLTVAIGVAAISAPRLP
jgi:Ca-activated chloride channel family protein